MVRAPPATVSKFVALTYRGHLASATLQHGYQEIFLLLSMSQYTTMAPENLGVEQLWWRRSADRDLRALRIVAIEARLGASPF